MSEDITVGMPMKRNNVAKFNLLMLLIKLELYPFVIFDGEIYPASRYSPEYGRWFYGSTFG